MLAACLLFAVLMMRSVSVCVFVFLSVNVNIFRVAAIQVQAKGAASPFSALPRDVRPRPVRRESTGPESRNNRKCSTVTR